MLEIKEYIEFFEFNSKTEGFYIVEHNAPSPDEKEVIENLPFMQGVYDFSMLLGERIFDNRAVTVKMIKPMLPYEDRKRAEENAKAKLMLNGIGPIKDSYLDGCHWVGKCESVDVDDDQEKNSITLSVVFDCYPFAIKSATSYSDEFDIDYFTDGVDQWTGFDVNGSKKVLLINTGVNRIGPSTYASAEMEIHHSEGVTKIPKGDNKDYFFKLEKGLNEFTIVGNGHISFYMEQEVMV